jgi:uncharacterized protein (DUF1786 family)
MQLLCLDIGSGTQDVLLMDTSQPVENAVQMVLPAPSVLVAQRMKVATACGEPIILIGDTMGGGACTGALKEHLDMGLEAYALPLAARTFSDDLDRVVSWGVKLISSDEADRLKSGTVIKMGDITLEILEKALSYWDIRLALDVIAVAVLDHGAATPGESDRVFRFRQLEHQLRQNNTLESFIFTPEEVPDYLTRMHAVARSIGGKIPLVLMDTGAAATLGASLDRVVAENSYRLAVNLGNSHTLAFHLSGFAVMGLFEHHTSQLSLSKLESSIEKLASGDLRSVDIQEQGGHGALVLGKTETTFVSATGPRRELLAKSRLNPYFAAPFGSMMLAGCFGLARAVALKLHWWREELEWALLR